MRTDVVQFRNFYQSRLGGLTRDLIGGRISQLWGDAGGLRLAGFGYTSPYLDRFHGGASHTLNLMPAAQGVVRWPERGPGHAALCEDDAWPAPDAFFDRILVVHGLEESEAVRRLLREVWRVLADDGRLALVVPNRTSLWSLLDTSPFGFGRPYTKGQLRALLEDCMFAPTAWSQALHGPPFDLRFLVSSASAWERAGERLWTGLAGALLVEASKEMLAPRPVRGLARVLPQPAIAPLTGDRFNPSRTNFPNAATGSPPQRTDSPSGRRAR